MVGRAGARLGTEEALATGWSERQCVDVGRYS